ncbi:MAG: threonylcarbamoyl-AMP synthase [Eggerthellaceae bacterium]|nr:threonylcarbamoyl-AMP synthase [Eggerthellaceae bacterium]
MNAEEVFDRAVEELRAGRAVVFPTDTVYGLGVAVAHASGPEAIYELKRRDAGKPVAWLVGDVADLERYGRDVSPEVFELARRFWPGALTIIVNASAAVPRAFAPTGTIGLRMPASEVALALAHSVGPLATSSANRAGQPAPQTLAQVDERILSAVRAVLPDEAPASGISSTVVDATSPELAILRQGSVRL